MSDFSNAVRHKSARSGGSGCVEVATVERAVGVRDQKIVRDPILVFKLPTANQAHQLVLQQFAEGRAVQ
jgi:hypothetical protein